MRLLLFCLLPILKYPDIQSFVDSAVQWVNSSTSTNTLATGFNTTTNSDARIFAADGNATMRDLASNNQVFQDRCADLLSRMIHTVPKGVQLTDVVTPIPVKPWLAQLSIDNNGKLQFEGYIRVRETILP